MEGKAALFKQFGGVDAWPVVPGHPGHRGDHRDRQGDRPGLRRDQPGGHRRPALLRDRAPAAGRARHPGLPRRPARHRDRRARRADQRAARGRQEGLEGRPDRGQRGRRRRSRDHPAAARTRASTDIIGCDRHGAHPPGQPTTSTSTAGGSPTHTNPRGAQGTLARCCVGADVFIGVSAPEPARPATTSPRWPTRRDRVRAGQPRPRGRPVRGQQARRGRGHRPLATTRTRSTTCWRSPGSSAACWTPAPSEITDEMLIAAADRDRRLRRAPTS